MMSTISPFYQLYNPNEWLSRGTETFLAVQKAFAQVVLLAFPDFDISFHVHADASGNHIGNIMKRNKVCVCYSQSLNKIQVNFDNKTQAPFDCGNIVH